MRARRTSASFFRVHMALVARCFLHQIPTAARCANICCGAQGVEKAPFAPDIDNSDKSVQLSCAVNFTVRLNSVYLPPVLSENCIALANAGLGARPRKSGWRAKKDMSCP
jgi:hypothetical protein